MNVVGHQHVGVDRDKGAGRNTGAVARCGHDKFILQFEWVDMHQFLTAGLLPLAHPDREAEAKARFPYRQMSAIAYAATEGHLWDCFSYGDHVYCDPLFNDWIHALDDILSTPGELGRIQEAVTDSQLSAEADLQRHFEANLGLLDPGYASRYPGCESFCERASDAILASLRRLNRLPRTDPFWANTNGRATVHKLDDFARLILQSNPRDSQALWTRAALEVSQMGDGFGGPEWRALHALGDFSVEWPVCAALLQGGCAGISAEALASLLLEIDAVEAARPLLKRHAGSTQIGVSAWAKRVFGFLHLCDVCGESHTGGDLETIFSLPDEISRVAPASAGANVSRTLGCFQSGGRYFIRGKLVMHLHDEPAGYYGWVVWAQVKWPESQSMLLSWEGGDNGIYGAPVRGRLANALPGYGQTLGLHLHIYFMGSTSWPEIRIEGNATHPAALDMANGMSYARYHEILTRTRHDDGALLCRDCRPASLGETTHPVGGCRPLSRWRALVSMLRERWKQIGRSSR